MIQYLVHIWELKYLIGRRIDKVLGVHRSRLIREINYSALNRESEAELVIVANCVSGVNKSYDEWSLDSNISRYVSFVNVHFWPICVSTMRN